MISLWGLTAQDEDVDKFLKKSACDVVMTPEEHDGRWLSRRGW